jgi:hypothetical protein
MNKLIVLSLLFALVGQVSAVNGARCNGNVLTYSDMFNVPVKRDCSILHSGNGQVFRGECRSYDGGADCWRTNGTVTPEYRDLIRGYTYNSTDPWGPAYNPPTTTIPSITTVTVPFFDVTKCPKCDVCPVCEDCQPYKNVIDSVNISYSTCKSNFAACDAKASKMIYKDTYDSQKAEYEDKIKVLTSDSAAKDKEIIRLTKNSDLYYYMALGACVIVIFVIGVWVKYEWIGDPKGKDLLEPK